MENSIFIQRLESLRQHQQVDHDKQKAQVVKKNYNLETDCTKCITRFVMEQTGIQGEVFSQSFSTGVVFSWYIPYVNDIIKNQHGGTPQRSMKPNNGVIS